LGQGPIDGESEAPEWQAVFDLGWELGPFFVSYEFSWFDETARYSPETVAGEPDIADSRYLEFSAHEVHDLYARYSLDDGLSLYAGIKNVTDEQPDIGMTYYPVSAVGRFFYAGLTWAAE
jgi:iron complex outermembrane recepter protein